MKILFERYACGRLARYKKLLELDDKVPTLRGVSFVFLGSIIFVVGKSPIDIMEPILCRKKVP